MTKYWEELSVNKIKTFNQFLNTNNITQTEAAKLLSISKGQLSHILKGERTLNDFIFWRMNYIMDNKKPQVTGGIYGIYYNNILIYIGRTNNFESRFKNHKSLIKSNKIDDSPFHNSGFDITQLSYQVLFDCEQKFLYPKELSRLEELMIRTVLPEWNTDISTLSSKHCLIDEKIKQLVELHNIHLSLLNKEINEYELPITSSGEEVLLKANEYTEEEIEARARRIISNAAIRPMIGGDTDG